MITKTIYVYLLNEGTDVWAPVDAEHIREDVYRITNCRGTDAATQFGEGELVRCRLHQFCDGEGLVAYEKAT